MELSEVKEVYRVTNLYHVFGTKIIKTSKFYNLQRFDILGKVLYTCSFNEDDNTENDVYLTFNDAKEAAIISSQDNIESCKSAIKNSEEKIKLLKELKDD